MRRALLTLLMKENPLRGYLIRIPALVSLFIVVTLATVRAQAPAVGTVNDCTCLQNSTDPALSQFSETFVIAGTSGATWSVVSAANFYMTTSPSPPAAPTPFPMGYNIPESPAGSGTYLLTGIRTPGTNWSITISNGTSQYTFNAIHTCHNPTPVITGDPGNCVDAVKMYSIDVADSDILSGGWSISGGGTILSQNNLHELTVEWTTPGTYSVEFNGAIASFTGQSNTANACDFNLAYDVEVMSEAAIPLACNNLVNLSLNNNCELSVVADMILEDMQLTNMSYDIVLRDIEADTIVPNNIIPIDYVGKTLEVKVVHECSGNSCWGYIKLEDKNIPPLVCPGNLVLDCNELTDPNNTGFPLPPGYTPIDLGDEEYLVQGFDPCSDVHLEYFDEPLDMNLCVGPYSSIIDRTWRATDGSGNVSTCTQRISVNRATLDDLVMPGSWDDVLGPNPSIAACTAYPELDNGNPSPEYTGYPQGTFCLNVSVEYTDKVLPICGDHSFKVIRRWVVTDLCSNEDSTYNQYITVMDNQPPVCTAPEEFEVGTNTLSCGTSFDVPPPIVIFECSEWDYFVSYKLTDESGNPYQHATTDGVVRKSDGSYTITNVPGGQDSVWIVYTIEDVCGNISQCFTEVGIVDDEEPVAVCDLHTFVALNEDGWAIAGVNSFDDGSWDNCMLDRMEVRRMTSACGISTAWGDHVKFCCADVGKVIQIQLRVWDKAGHSNSCMVEAEVQDNRPPTITCPANRTIDCRSDLSDLSAYGVPTALDNCGATITEVATSNIDDCGAGTITRVFTATDSYGNSASCTQVITVKNTQPFTSSNIKWPGDVTLTNGCLDAGIDPDVLPSGKQRPVLTANSCSKVAADYDDVVFQVVEGACFKVLRTWTVIDWCQFNPFQPTVGRWTHTQVIMGQNTIKPTITRGCSASQAIITPLNGCNAQLELAAEATDDCSESTSLLWTYSIDFNSDGTIDLNGTGNYISRVVNYGLHTINWTVRDECGNYSTCSVQINVQDTKAPTPYCLSEIVTVLMENSGSVTIWASDFDKGSYDNCTTADNLILAFSTNPSNTSRTFTCDDMTGSTTTFDVDIYAIDQAGNYDFCTTTIKVQDNSGVCDETGGRVSVGGIVTTENSESLTNVNLTLNSGQPEYPRITETNDNGQYAFQDLAMYNNYAITSEMEDDYRNGVSTLDIVLIQRHILGLSSLDSPYKVIAADVNGNENVSSSDLIILRKLILGLIDELPEGVSWKFVDAHQQFTDIKHPWPFNSSMQMQDLDHDVMKNDFVGVKMGDVNNSLNLPNARSANSDTRSNVNLVFNNTALVAGQTYQVKFNTSGINDLIGMQFTIGTSDKLDLIGITSDKLDVNDSNSALNIKTKLSTFSWNATAPVDVDGDILTLIVRAKNNISDLSQEMYMTSQLATQEIYTLSSVGTVDTYKLNLDTKIGEEITGTFELYQNIPNPFGTSSTIGFSLPEEGDATLKIYDYNGRILFEKTKKFSKGYNEIVINADELNTTGILYYQLDSNNHSSNRKMIIIK